MPHTVLCCLLLPPTYAVPSKNPNGHYAVVVTYEQPEQAEQAIRQLNGYEYQESKLRVSELGQAPVLCEYCMYTIRFE